MASESSFESAHEPPGTQKQTPVPKPINDPLEDAYQAMSAEERDRDRHWVMWGQAHGEIPSEPSDFLARFMAAEPDEQKAFRARRVQESARRAA
jgi:hypothetical protein